MDWLTKTKQKILARRVRYMSVYGNGKSGGRTMLVLHVKQ